MVIILKEICDVFRFQVLASSNFLSPLQLCHRCHPSETLIVLFAWRTTNIYLLIPISFLCLISHTFGTRLHRKNQFLRKVSLTKLHHHCHLMTIWWIRKIISRKSIKVLGKQFHASTVVSCLLGSTLVIRSLLWNNIWPQLEFILR